MQPLAEALLGEVEGEVRAEVGGDRVIAGAVDDARLGALRVGVALVDHAADEVRLAGEVAVARAVRGAGAGELEAVLGVRAHRGEDDLRSRHDRVERGAVLRVGDEEREGGERLVRRREVRTHLLELRAAPAAERPCEPLVGGAPREVLGDELAREPGRSVEQDIDLSHEVLVYLDAARARISPTSRSSSGGSTTFAASPHERTNATADRESTSGNDRRTRPSGEVAMRCCG